MPRANGESLMKICPVCNESFIDEMNFCDVDGSPLDRDAVTVHQARSRLWSLVGVALLIGALALSITVLFMPKPRPAPALVNPTPPLTAAAPQPALPDSSPKRTVESTNEPESASAATLPPDPKPRDRSADLVRPTAGPAPNPKAAALENDQLAPRRSEPSEQPVALKPEPAK